MSKVAVIGGGPSGMMAASTAAQRGHEVFLFEKNNRPGRKLYITGNGRCNLTNNAPIEELVLNIPVNARFLYSAFHLFSASDTISFFENLGVPLKTERGNRVFPLSDKASDIVDALVRHCRSSGVSLRTNEAVCDILIEDGHVKGVIQADNSRFSCDNVIVATGGLSYPLTGSTGDGYAFAKKAGHTVTPLKPSLVPFNIRQSFCRDLQGLTLKNVGIRVCDGNRKEIYADFGELMFTHFGVTGPVVISASSHLSDYDQNRYCMTIDLKPALDQDILSRRLQKDFLEFAKKDFINSLDKLLPQKLIPVIVDLSGIDPRKKASGITKEERTRLTDLLKGLKLDILSARPIEEAIVTSGGIAVNEINPKTMESKLVKGLYFTGEIIDADGYTGGFNLQIAFTTGYVSGISIQ